MLFTGHRQPEENKYKITFVVSMLTCLKSNKVKLSLGIIKYLYVWDSENGKGADQYEEFRVAAGTSRQWRRVSWRGSPIGGNVWCLRAKRRYLKNYGGCWWGTEVNPREAPAFGQQGLQACTIVVGPMEAELERAEEQAGGEGSRWNSWLRVL